jgi:hypothetical protein
LPYHPAMAISALCCCNDGVAGVISWWWRPRWRRCLRLRPPPLTHRFIFYYFSGHRLDTGNHKANDVRYVHSVNMSSYARDRLGQWGSGDGVSPSTLSGLDRLRHPGVTKVWDCFVDNLLLVTWWNSTRALDDVATLLLTKHEPVRCGFFRAC